MILAKLDAQASQMINVTLRQLEEVFAYAREAAPDECCGLIGGDGENASSLYPMRNVATNATVAYEAAPEDLFAAQRQMRERGEQLLAIYHSHPRAIEPQPSETDVRLAFYPQAIYFIIALDGEHPVMRAFNISETEGRWEQVEYAITGE
ncbi:MAG: Mov34/MPN/PAD-1 family protein [Pyrinomonadaceae bacterium]